MNGVNGSGLAAFGLMVVLSASCTESDSVNPTSTSSDGSSSIRVDLIPDSLQTRLKQHIAIYEGDDPPDIEGCYTQSHSVLTYSSRTGDSSKIGKRYDDMTMCFERKADGSTYTFKGKEYKNDTVDGTHSSDSIHVIGSGNRFTAYFVDTGSYSRSCWYKEATVITGVKRDSGIADLTYTFLMLDRGDTSLVEIGTIRSFDDSDKFSPKAAKSAARAMPKSVERIPSIFMKD